jgi:hypothetical protein
MLTATPSAFGSPIHAYATRPGRPRKTSAKEDVMILRTVKRHPQQSRSAIPALRKKTVLSLQTIRRRLKEAGYRYKWIVKRPVKAPEQPEYERCKKPMAELERREEPDEIELAYADAAGFSLQAPQPMAWQHPEPTLWLEAQSHGQCLNVFGFLRKNNAFEAVVFEPTINDDCVIAAIDHYIRNRTKDSLPLHIPLDNAPSHHTDAMVEAQER